MKTLVFLIAGGLFAFTVGGVVGVAIYLLLVAAWFIGLFFSSLNSPLDHTDKRASGVAAPAATGNSSGSRYACESRHPASHARDRRSGGV